jgi:lipopolysaccharide/colanic/teichoic acid biosynthesis glycosyltransferase
MIRLFRVFVPTNTLALALFETIVIVAAFTLAIYLWFETDPGDYLFYGLGSLSVALVSVSFLAGLYFQDLYTELRVQSRLLLVQQLLTADGIAFLLQALASSANPGLYIPLRVMLLGSAMAVTTLFAGRLLFSAYVIPYLAGERLLLVGESPLLDDIARYLEKHPQMGLHVAGHIRRFEPAAKIWTGPTAHPLEEQIRRFDSKRIVIGMNPGPDHQLASDLLEMRFLGYSVQDAAGTYAKLFNREGLSDLGVSRLMYAGEFDPNKRTLFFQAFRNWLLAALGVTAFSPLLLVIAALTRLSGPVLDRQVCCGRFGKHFTLYRFRVGPGWVGRFLARSGLYALPQLFNVLRGQMSMVGPRPQRPEFVAELTRYIPFYPHRLSVPPGMTGWAQIQGRRHAGLPDAAAELEYDLYYIKYISATMDIFLLVQAVKNILLWGGQP